MADSYWLLATKEGQSKKLLSHGIMRNSSITLEYLGIPWRSSAERRSEKKEENNGKFAQYI